MLADAIGAVLLKSEQEMGCNAIGAWNWNSLQLNHYMYRLLAKKKKKIQLTENDVGSSFVKLLFYVIFIIKKKKRHADFIVCFPKIVS